ncbi:hypothetical protein FEE95_07735 [Maribacter algarum]|uniref:Lipoprotein n=1 Tax=Maribacter algarum (ex Zhang et al. 2020) TaxID=2578118 RepID=A0A5S3PWG5_9FLAO|nr:hypothetical protein [Maribacter algarum]TMM59313.1 hypothetical protein FEE95_07735 [Maribacter algarum]
MKRIVYLVLILSLVSCNSRGTKKTKYERDSIQVSDENELPKGNEEAQVEKPKLNTTAIQKYAQLILENKVSPSDNNETFECLDQLFQENKKDLNFYFEVFRVIVKKSDGALSEVIGQYIVTFLRSYPNYFIERYTDFEFEEKMRFIDFMAYEFYFAGTDFKVEINEFFAGINNAQNLDSDDQIRTLSEIKELVTKATEGIIAGSNLKNNSILDSVEFDSNYIRSKTSPLSKTIDIEKINVALLEKLPKKFISEHLSPYKIEIGYPEHLTDDYPDEYVFLEFKVFENFNLYTFVHDNETCCRTLYAVTIGKENNNTINIGVIGYEGGDGGWVGKQYGSWTSEAIIETTTTSDYDEDLIESNNNTEVDTTWSFIKIDQNGYFEKTDSLAVKYIGDKKVE